MTEDDYDREYLELRRSFNRDQRLLDMKYAFANSIIKVGDIIEDNLGRVRVTQIGHYLSMERRYPFCRHLGVCITLAGVDFKNGRTRSVYQENIK